MINLTPELVVVVMFGLLLLCIMVGFPLGFGLIGVAIVIGFLAYGGKVGQILYSQAFGQLQNYTFVAVPLFIFMGIMVERSKIGEALFVTLGIWLHGLRGYLAIVVVLTGTAMAACVGVISASVVMLGMVAMPYMMEQGYNKELACGCICAGGCLGILIPPSVMLIIYGPLAEISVGKLLMAAFMPGFLLSVLYLVYIFIRCRLNPSLAPSPREKIDVRLNEKIRLLFTSVVPVVVLIGAVLGSIFLGIAAPTEAAAVGAFCATGLAIARRGLTFPIFKQVALETAKVTGMIALVAIGARCFTGVFMALGGQEVMSDLLMALPGGRWGVFTMVMFLVFILGFFIGWLGILFIMVPLVTPIAAQLGFHELWFAMMICINLQMSFMTPPFAVAIFFLRGVIPDEYGINTSHIIRGVIPFIALIMVGLSLCIAFPQIILWLPSVMIR